MRRAAFTLLELVVVLTLAAILMALAVPRFSAMRDGASVRAAVADLTADFSMARQSAMTRRVAVAVVLDTTSGVVELRSAARTLSRRPLRAMYGIVLGANRDSAVYDSRGLGYGVSNLTMTVRRGLIVDTLTMSRLGRLRW
ncbi:MAG TPA: prepilin-type N-terminal cleavage/methylation domain-containing protein [Gemmatimonadaceae bacterium]